MRPGSILVPCFRHVKDAFLLKISARAHRRTVATSLFICKHCAASCSSHRTCIPKTVQNNNIILLQYCTLLQSLCGTSKPVLTISGSLEMTLKYKTKYCTVQGGCETADSKAKAWDHEGCDVEGRCPCHLFKIFKILFRSKRMLKFVVDTVAPVKNVPRVSVAGPKFSLTVRRSLEDLYSTAEYIL